MKRLLVAGFVGTLAWTWTPPESAAQATIEVAGAVTFPTGEYEDVDGASAGWLAHAGVSFPVGEAPVAAGATGFFGSNNHEVEGDKTNLYGGVAHVTYLFGDPSAIAPFIRAMGGFLTQSYESDTQPGLEDSWTGPATGGGIGVGVPLGRIGGFLEAWWLIGFGDVRGTALGGVSAGIQVPIGGAM